MSQHSSSVLTGMRESAVVREVPMKVLCLGYSRTGTRSLRDALLRLGYVHTYHTFDAAWINPHDCKLWLDAHKAKYDGIGPKPGREDFDRILGHCQAVTDMPAAYFAPESVQAYPEAKVILTVRDVDEWHRFTQRLLGLTSQFLLMPDRWNYPMFQKLTQVLFDGDFERNGRASFERHYELVRSLVPPERLLEYRVSDGWGPLCKFLDRHVPEEDAPFINRGEGFAERFSENRKRHIRAQVKRVLDLSAYAALAYVAVSVVRRGRFGFQL